MVEGEALSQLLHDLEQRLLQPAVRHSADELRRLLSEDFVEIGSGGRVYDIRSIIEELGKEKQFLASISDFNVAILAPGVVLATYRASHSESEKEPPQHSLRSSIWKLVDDNWQMVFHQGTPVSGNHE